MTLIGEGPATTELALGTFVGADGQPLSGLRLRYRVVGNLDAARENGWILVFHALTGSADAEAWWGPLIGPGRALDTSRHALVSANLLGSCYGSTGPQEWATEHDEPFPDLTPADLALAHVPLLEHLGVERLALATGGSLGGMVALEWGRLSSVPLDRLVVFAAPAATSAQAIAWNTVQRMAIEADPAWRRGRYLPGHGPDGGTGRGARAGDDHLSIGGRIRRPLRAYVLTHRGQIRRGPLPQAARATNWWPGSTRRATSRSCGRWTCTTWETSRRPRGQPPRA